MKLPLDQPVGSLLVWLNQHPEAVYDAFRLLNILSQIHVELTTPESGGGAPKLTISDTNAILSLPYQFQSPWAVPTGSPSRASFDANATTTPSATYQQAEAATVATRLTATRQTLAALILDLQRVGLARTV